MKRIFYIISALALFLCAASCQEEPVIVHKAAVKTVTPMADESGAVKVYQGDEVTLDGFNLDVVSKVTVGDAQAEIITKSIKSLVFTVPDFPEFEQSDNTHLAELKVYDGDGKTVVYNHPYFISVPVTDALVSEYSPASGTVGQVITVKGRNLEQVTKIVFAEAEIAAADFVSQLAGEITFAAPAVNVTGADNNIAIKAIWGGGREIDVTGETPFVLTVPVFDAYTATEAVKIGDEITVNGTHLDLVSELKWRTYTMVLSSKTAESITFKVPGSAAETSSDAPGKYEATDVLKATYGTPAQELTVASAFKIDITPVGPAKPVYASMACAEAGYTLFHLGRLVTVIGQNMENIESFTVDGIAAPLVGTSTATGASFMVPKTITGTAKKSVKLVALYNNGETAFEQNMDVYPYYYTKGLRIRIGSNSNSTYPADNSEEAFLILDSATVISTQKFKDGNVDAFALGTQSVITGAGKAAATATADQYYSVAPYYFAQTNSSNKLVFNSPANSSSQLKTHRINGTSVSTNYGTPSVMAAIVKDDVAAAALAGNMEDIAADQTLCGKGAPACGSDWKEGSVIKLQYADFTHVLNNGGPLLDIANVRKTGYIVIREITCVNEDYTAKADRAGYIEFDLLWSNVLQ